ncbi:MAG: Aldo/keto [Planctomycetota bacterium]|nr:MAG: Aldo/keto [Planctomycetota bacterium]
MSAFDLKVFPLCLGGNVFGWTADEAASFAVLDAYAEAGGNFVDTADMYSAWVPGHAGGESEAILGRWMAARGCRDRMVIATKVGQLRGLEGLSAATIRTAAENSLRRLQTDRIDLYYAHIDDAKTPLAETLGAFDALVRAGKVKRIAASNYTATRLAEALAISKSNGLARYVAIQPHYNLMHRTEYEGDLAALCAREGITCFPYFALAKGFLTGKYRPGKPVDSVRSTGASAYLDARGLRVLAALDEIAAAHKTTVAAVALAWLRVQPTVGAPIASARTPAQLAELLPSACVQLSQDELSRLGTAGATGFVDGAARLAREAGSPDRDGARSVDAAARTPR